ncbi:MAG: metalloregulator ArsR/SmtB family transcription factor [Candidatus Omnitrophica bacterium]|nr:metalloregulator ArsR/SmtB family transcription factor [Candidatus Omnitrophota bacterium]
MDVLMLQKTMKLLADKTRLRILFIIYKQEVMVKDICQVLEINQPTVSRHLAKLRMLGIIVDRREGNAIYYHIDNDREHFRVIEVIMDECKNIEIFKMDIEKFNALSDEKTERGANNE